MHRPLTLERLRHVPGELLRSGDLRDQVAGDAELLWWHQRAVHDAAGVVAGLVVHSEKGGPVSVTPGLAYDSRGRELVLTRQATIDLPDVEHPLVLVLRHCGARPPELAWVALGRLDRCAGVPLARLDPGGDGQPQPWAARGRGTARPRVASGATLSGATAWAPWLTVSRLTQRARGLEVRVNTRAAGFTTLPCYFAWLQWPGAASPNAIPAHRGFGLQHLADETVDGFTFRVVLVGAAAVGLSSPESQLARRKRRDGLTAYARTQRLSVAWLAIEADPTAEVDHEHV
jgi:hypothetical protein